jgi:hypothetical protein
MCSTHDHRWRSHGRVDDGVGRYGGQNAVMGMTPDVKKQHLTEMAEWVRREALFPTVMALVRMANDVSS